MALADETTTDAMGMTPAEMRAAGYKVIDTLVDHLERLRTLPVANRPTRAAMEAALREDAPEEGRDLESVLARLSRDVFTNNSLVNHPRFFAFVPGPGNFIGAMGDALASGVNIFSGTWLGGAAIAQMEMVVIDWLRRECGMPEEAGGLFVSGGSMANLTAVAVARHHRLAERTDDAVIYMSNQTHSSVTRGLRVQGFDPRNLAILPVDADLRLSMGALRDAVEATRAEGKTPFCVIANAGTINTGAIDPLDAMADLCQAENIWLHADGAYGAAAVVCERGRAALAGLERVDSLALDPHKWLFQPMGIGCTLVRDRRLMVEAFHNRPEYLKDVQRSDEEICFTDHGFELSRGARTLKLWMTIQVHGMGKIRRAVARGFELAELAEARLRARERWEILSPAQMAVVVFRFAPEGMADGEVDALNHGVMQAMMDDGYAMLTSTLIEGREALRLCTTNPATADAEIEETVARLDALARKMAAGG